MSFTCLGLSTFMEFGQSMSEGSEKRLVEVVTIPSAGSQDLAKCIPRHPTYAVQCRAEFRAFLPSGRAYPLIQNSRLSISLFLSLILHSSDGLSLHHVLTCTEEVVFATWGPFLCAGVQFNRHLRNVPNPIPKPKHVRSCKTCLHLRLPITEVEVFPNLTLNPTPTPPLYSSPCTL